MPPVVVVAVAALLEVGAACTNGDVSSSSSQPKASPTTTNQTTPPPSEIRAPRIIAFRSYLRRRPSFEATSLVAVDPETFQPVKGTELRLGDSVTTRLADPARRLIAFGGHNFGEVILVDPEELEIEAKVKVSRGGGLSPEVQLVGWPTADRVFGYSQAFAAHNLNPGRAFIMDPSRRKLVKSVPLHGSVVAATATERGVALLVCPVRKVGGTRLVLIDTQGRKQTVPLEKITAGFVDPGTPGDSLARTPALVSIGSSVYVISAAEPVAAVSSRTAKVSYRSIPGLMTRHLPASTFPATGSAGALESRHRAASVINGPRVLVSGSEAYPVRGGSHLRSFARVSQAVDLHNWRVRHAFTGLSDLQVSGGVLFGRSLDRRLTALRANGSVIFRRPAGKRSWVVVGDRLVEAARSGRSAVELDIRTGREVRSLGRLELWPLDGTTWPPTPGDPATDTLIVY